MSEMTEKAADRYAAKLAKGVWFTPEKPVKDTGEREPSENEQLYFQAGWVLFSTLAKAEVSYQPASGPTEFFPSGRRAEVYVHAVGPVDDPAWMSVPAARALAKAILKACRLAEEAA